MIITCCEQEKPSRVLSGKLFEVRNGEIIYSGAPLKP